MVTIMAEQSIAERLPTILRLIATFGAVTPEDVAMIERAADELDRLTKERDEAREALTDIAVYGCGMLNQPAAMNAPEEVWLQKRIREYERVARAALNKDTANG